jgi:hypothetical protein
MSEIWTVVTLLATSVASLVIMALLGPPTNLFVLGLSFTLLAACLLFAHFSSSRATERLGLVILVLGLACFLVALLEEFALGGTPLNGRRAGRCFFVGSHGHFHEVSEPAYRIALFFNLGLVLYWPSLIGLGIITGLHEKLRPRARPSGRRWPDI